jgi:hypothetical protein
LPLLLLTISTRQVRDFAIAMRAGADGDELAAELWREYSGEPGECFYCGAPITLPAFTQILPDKRRDQMLAVPLCPACAALPPMVRAHRGPRLMRKMSGVAR